MKLVEKLMKSGTIYYLPKDYEIIKIDEHNTYHQIWYKFPIKLYPRSEETGIDVGWVKIPSKDINKHLRAEKIKRLTNNVNNQ